MHGPLRSAPEPTVTPDPVELARANEELQQRVEALELEVAGLRRILEEQAGVAVTASARFAAYRQRMHDLDQRRRRGNGEERET